MALAAPQRMLTVLPLSASGQTIFALAGPGFWGCAAKGGVACVGYSGGPPCCGVADVDAWAERSGGGGPPGGAAARLTWSGAEVRIVHLTCKTRPGVGLLRGVGLMRQPVNRRQAPSSGPRPPPAVVCQPSPGKAETWALRLLPSLGLDTARVT